MSFQENQGREGNKEPRMPELATTPILPNTGIGLSPRNMKEGETVDSNATSTTADSKLMEKPFTPVQSETPTQTLDSRPPSSLMSDPAALASDTKMNDVLTSPSQKINASSITVVHPNPVISSLLPPPGPTNSVQTDGILLTTPDISSASSLLHALFSDSQETVTNASPFSKLPINLQTFGNGEAFMKKTSSYSGMINGRSAMVQDAESSKSSQSSSSSTNDNISFKLSLTGRDSVGRAIAAYEYQKKLAKYEMVARIYNAVATVHSTADWLLLPLTIKRTNTAALPRLYRTGVHSIPFHQFSRFPVELRLQIMAYNLPAPRLMKIEPIDALPLGIRDIKCLSKNSPNLEVFGMTRTEALKSYHQISRVYSRFHNSGKPIFFGMNDTLGFPPRWILKVMAGVIDLPFKNLSCIKKLSLDISSWTAVQVQNLLLGLDVFPALDTCELYYLGNKYPQIPVIWEDFCGNFQATFRKTWSVRKLTITHPYDGIMDLPVSAFKRAALLPLVETLGELGIGIEDIIGAVPWGGIQQVALQQKFFFPGEVSPEVYYQLICMINANLPRDRLFGTGRVLRGASKVILVREELETTEEAGIPELDVGDVGESEDEEEEEELW